MFCKRPEVTLCGWRGYFEAFNKQGDKLAAGIWPEITKRPQELDSNGGWLEPAFPG